MGDYLCCSDACMYNSELANFYLLKVISEIGGEEYRCSVLHSNAKNPHRQRVSSSQPERL